MPQLRNIARTSQCTRETSQRIRGTKQRNAETLQRRAYFTMYS